MSEPWPKKWRKLIQSQRDTIHHSHPEEVGSPGGPESHETRARPSAWADYRSSIVNEDKVTRLVEDWRPTDMAFIQKLLFTARDDETGFDVEIEFIACPKRSQTQSWPWEAEPKYGVSTRFGRVRDLKLRGFGGTKNQVMGFDIIALSDRGWEGAQFEIEDYEDGRIGFYCDEIEVLEAHLLPSQPSHR